MLTKEDFIEIDERIEAKIKETIRPKYYNMRDYVLMERAATMPRPEHPADAHPEANAHQADEWLNALAPSKHDPEARAREIVEKIRAGTIWSEGEADYRHDITKDEAVALIMDFAGGGK